MTKEQHDRENSVLTFYKKTVPLKSCLRVTLPVLILRASDLNSGKIFVSVKRTSKIHLPFLLKESAPYTESKIGESQNVPVNKQEAGDVGEELSLSGHFSGSAQAIGPPPTLVTYLVNLDDDAHLQPFLRDEDLNDDQ